MANVLNLMVSEKADSLGGDFQGTGGVLYSVLKKIALTQIMSRMNNQIRKVVP